MSRKATKQKPLVSLTNIGIIGPDTFCVAGYSDFIQKKYDTNCGCSGGECTSEYNKCYIIDNVKIININLEELAEECLRKKDVTHLVRYAAYRIISQSKLANKDNWQADVGRGYYGEEIHGFNFSDLKEIERVEQALLQITEDKTEKQLLDIALEFEYGYVLESLQGKSATTYYIDADAIVPVARDHYNRLDRNQVSKYQDKFLEKSWDKKPTKFQKLPVCVVLREGEKYRLIDGYHRYAAHVKSVGKNIHVIVVE